MFFGLTFLEVRALKNHRFRKSARSKTLFLDFKDSIDSLDSTDSIDSIESTDSIDIIDSIDSILVPHKETANIHTTHKGARALRARANKSTDGGGALRAPPPSVLLFSLCVWCECWRSLCVAQVKNP